MAFDGGQRVAGIEPREEGDRPAGKERREHRAEDAERMGERQGRQRNVVLREVHHRSAPGFERPGDRGLREQHALGIAGAARSVEHDRGVAGVRRGGGEIRLVRADRPDPAVGREIGEDALALARREPRVDRQHRGAGLEPAEQRDDDLDRIVEAERDPATAPDAVRRQRRGDRPRHAFEAPPVDGAAVGQQHLLAGPLPGLGLQKLREVVGHRGLRPVRFGCGRSPRSPHRHGRRRPTIHVLLLSFRREGKNSWMVGLRRP